MNDHHYLHYIFLFTGILLAAVLFSYFSHSYTIQVIIAALGSVYYSLWGIIHHALEGRLTRLIALEYTLIGLFVFFLLFLAMSL